MSTNATSGLLLGMLAGTMATWLTSASCARGNMLELRGPKALHISEPVEEYPVVEINPLLARAFDNTEKVYLYDPDENRVVTQPQRPRPIMIPVHGVVVDDLFNSFHHGRDGGRIHNAIDIMAPEDTPILAADNGIITKLHESDAGGLTIYQLNPDATRVYYYAHLEDYAADLREGMPVKKGDLIGYVGSSGNADSDAPHLHFAIHRLGPQKRWWRGTPVNPYPLLGGQ